jgi:hypothetical protein
MGDKPPFDKRGFEGIYIGKKITVPLYERGIRGNCIRKMGVISQLGYTVLPFRPVFIQRFSKTYYSQYVFTLGVYLVVKCLA